MDSSQPERQQKSIRRWLPKLRTKDLFWLILMAALLMCWYRDRLQLQTQIDTLTAPQSSSTSWSITQLLGKPDTPGPGDQATAWAPAGQANGTEWVIVEFPFAVNVQHLVVYETYMPGAVSRICSVDFRGRETQIWAGTDPAPANAGMSLSKFVPKTKCKSRRFKIFLDSAGFPGWNEIDAVALHDDNNRVHWASNAWASSSYGDNQAPPSWYWP